MDSIKWKLEKIQDGFNILCRCAQELNTFSSMFSCYILLARTISSSVFLFYLVSAVFHSRRNSLNFALILPSIMIDIFYLIVLFNAADSPVYQVN